jgi:ABC-type transport system involved in multi-copper enzyme maturation permease subunit
LKTSFDLQKISLHDLWHSIRTIDQRILQTSLNGLGVYLVLSVGILISGLVLQNNLRFAERNLVYISSQPLFLPIMVNTFLVATYLAISAAIQLSRERDRGTYEVLLFGPVNETTFILGYFLGNIKIYLATLLVTFVWANLASWFLHLGYSLMIVVVLLQSILMASAILGFALVTAVWGKRTRTALVSFFFIILLLVGFQIGDAVVNTIMMSSQQASDSLLLLRNAFATIANLTEWISPYAQMSIAMEAIVENAAGSYGLHVIIIMLQAILFLLLAVTMLRRKGGHG